MGMLNAVGIVGGSKVKLRNNCNSKPGAKERRQRRAIRKEMERYDELESILRMTSGKDGRRASH